MDEYIGLCQHAPLVAQGEARKEHLGPDITGDAFELCPSIPPVGAKQDEPESVSTLDRGPRSNQEVIDVRPAVLDIPRGYG